MEYEHIILQPPSPIAAPPLLFVHGAWHGAWCWEPFFLPYFVEQGFVVHAMSLRSHGKSDGNQKTRGIHFADYVADVAAVCETIEQPPIIIAHSAGGAVVQKYVETHDAAGVVLLASLPPDPILGASFGLLAAHPLALLQSSATFSLKSFVATPQRAKSLFFSKSMPLEKVARYQQQMQDESMLVLFDLALSRQIHPKIIMARQPRTPFLVLGAANDSVLAPRLHEKMAAGYGTTAQIISDIAHDMMLEDRWQVAAEAIATWLKAHKLAQA